MKAHYGYEDGSGRYYITVDTEACDACGKCIEVCPAGVLAMVEEDPVEERMVAGVAPAHGKKIKYSCAPCKPTGHGPLPCVAACAPGAIVHSW